MGFGLSPAGKVKVGKTKLFAELASVENDIFSRWAEVVRCAEGKNYRGFRARDRTSYILAATSPNPNNLWPDGVEFRGDMVLKARQRGFTTQGPVLLFYLQMICDYVNNYYKLGGTSDPTTRNVPLMATWQNNITNVDDVQGVPAKNSIFTIVPGYHLDYEAISAQMTAQLLGPSNFFSVKHIFIPIEYSIIYSRAGEVDTPVIYTTLLVISPQDRTIDWLDPLFSLGEDKIKEIQGYDKATVIPNILRLLSYHLGPLFIPGKWRIRRTGSTPITDEELNRKNCTFTAATNAMCIAFGYPLSVDYTDIFTVLERRRTRVTSDLLHGSFERDPRSEFHYPISDIVPETSAGQDGWTGIPYSDLTHLPLSSVARTGKYDAYTYGTLSAYCRKMNTRDRSAGHPARYHNFQQWAKYDIKDFIMRVELADFLLKYPNFHSDARDALSQAQTELDALLEQRNKVTAARRAAAKEALEKGSEQPEVIGLESSDDEDVSEEQNAVQVENEYLRHPPADGGVQNLVFYEEWLRRTGAPVDEWRKEEGGEDVGMGEGGEGEGEGQAENEEGDRKPGDTEDFPYSVYSDDESADWSQFSFAKEEGE